MATHTGLARIGLGANPEWVGATRFDLMGFTVSPADRGMLYASGHPDLVTYRREGHGNLDLLLSRDGGRSWEGVALKGQMEFHIPGPVKSARGVMRKGGVVTVYAV